MNLKEIKQRIHSVKSTQKITSAMKLVSSAKLRRTQGAIERLRHYEQKLDEIFASLLGCVEVKSEYSVSREVKKVVVIAVASDTTLCGAFNANITRLAKEVVTEYRAAGVDVEVMPVGKKMHESFRKQGVNTVDALMQQAGAPVYNEISAVAKALMQRFVAGELDRVELVYTHFISVAKFELKREAFLPVDTLAHGVGNGADVNGFILEPDKEQLLQALIPQVVTMRLYVALLDSAVAEHAARMMAMQIATENANNLIGELTLEYNKGRQQAITNELLDIISGSSN